MYGGQSSNHQSAQDLLTACQMVPHLPNDMPASGISDPYTEKGRAGQEWTRLWGREE